MKGKGLLLWVAGFAGVLLLYSAYKGENPLTLIESYGNDPTPTKKHPHQTHGAGGGGTHKAHQAAIVRGNGQFGTAPAAYTNPSDYIDN